MKRLSGSCALLLLLTLGISACDEDEPTPSKDMGRQDMMVAKEDMQPDLKEDMPPEAQGPVLRFDVGGEDFFDAPFPSDVKLTAEGKVDFAQWKIAYERKVLPLWFDASKELLEGWSPISGVFVSFDAAIDPSSLPKDAKSSIETSVAWPSVFLMDVDESSPDKGKLLPLECRFTQKAGVLTPGNLLGCMSPMGIVRRIKNRYAFVITKNLKDAQGQSVQAPEQLLKLMGGEDLKAGERTFAAAPTAQAKEVILKAGLSEDDLVAINVFTTGDPKSRLRKVNEFYRALPEPTLDRSKGIKLIETYDDFVVLEAYYTVPIVQEGDFPYSAPPAGKLKLNAGGEVEQVGEQSIRVFITVPRGPMPDAGYPLLVYMHGSGGVARELIDRGPQPDTMTPAPAGTGPGGVVAKFGVAGFAADFQFHGMRFDPPDTSGLKLYNLIDNPRATVDNFIVAANEVTLHARLMKGLTLDPKEIEPKSEAMRLLSAGADGLIRFDADRFAAMGQSMGSTIGLPALTIDREIDAGIFSGSGGILIEIAVTSMKPVNVGGALRLLLRYGQQPLDQFDPVLHAVQHVWDYVDPVVHAEHVFLNPHEGVPAKHAIQHSGKLDGYFTPSSRAAFSLALGAPLVEPLVEPEALERMAWGGQGQPVQTPLQANMPSGVTALVVQYEPQVLDGHNVAYQRQDAQDQYGCFIKSLSKDKAPTFKSAEQSTPANCQP